MISICDMVQQLVEHEITVKVSREYDQGIWTIQCSKGDNSGVWAVSADNVETAYLSHDTIRLITISRIINYFDEKEREKEHEMKNEQKFTRDDLKPGYIIMLRNGALLSIQMVGKETLIATAGMDDPNWRYLSNGWDSQLNSTERGGKTFPSIVYDKTKDIVAVYGYVQGTINYSRCGEISSCHRPLLWSRYEAKKMTIEEIEKELGYKVEIVSD